MSLKSNRAGKNCKNIHVEVDKSSYSNPNEYAITHLEWTANVNFQLRSIFANAKYNIKLGEKSIDEIRFDSSSSLVIHSITNGESHPMTYSLSNSDPSKPHLGRCLRISIPSSCWFSASGRNIQVIIEYETTGGCSALQWLPPSQTSGKNYPYLFTQCQAIHARSLLPCMDCPGVKFTYEAR